jgi:hypothetical protein
MGPSSSFPNKDQMIYFKGFLGGTTPLPGYFFVSTQLLIKILFAFETRTPGDLRQAVESCCCDLLSALTIRLITQVFRIDPITKTGEFDLEMFGSEDYLIHRNIVEKYLRDEGFDESLPKIVIQINSRWWQATASTPHL